MRQHTKDVPEKRVLPSKKTDIKELKTITKNQGDEIEVLKEDTESTDKCIEKLNKTN